MIVVVDAPIEVINQTIVRAQDLELPKDAKWIAQETVLLGQRL